MQTVLFSPGADALGQLASRDDRRMTSRPFLSRLCLLAVSLLLPVLAVQAQLGSGGASGCDPSRQSCVPGSTPAPSPSSPAASANAGPGGVCRPGDAGATCDGSGPASQGNAGGADTGAGNPINVINGNKYQREVDMAALPGELGLELVRHYNSANARVIGALGAGWRLSYETELYVIGQTLQVLQADGTRLIFDIDAADPSHCTGADPAAGHIQIRHGRSASGQRQRQYIWHWTHGPHAGRKLHFNAAGKLEQIVAASGAALTVQRGPAGELLQVTDPQGRSLKLNWASRADVARAQAQQGGGYFAGVQSIDTPLGRFAYRHGSSGDQPADADRAQAANLIEVALPTHVEAGRQAHPWANRSASSSSVRRLYHYEDAHWPQMLTGISVQGAGSDGQQLDQRLSTYLYNARGQAILSVKGRPAELARDASGQLLAPARLQEGSGQEQVTLQYLEPALPTRAGTTLLANSLGQHTVYRHQVIAGQYRLLEARGAGCARCGPVNMRYDYDPQGRMTGWQQLAPTLIDPRAVTAGQPLPAAQVIASHSLQLDAQGNPIRSDVSGTPEQAEYRDSRWPDKPTLLTRASVVAGRQHRIELAYNEAGQLTELTERGYSPVDEQGEPIPTAIERTTRWRYQRINGRSVLVEVDGPLANGPRAEPSDSDITRYQWDERGSFVTQVNSPGGFESTLRRDDAGRVVEVRNDAGFATHWTWDARGQLTRLVSSGPGWQEPQVLSHKYDALGRRVESGSGVESHDADTAAEGALAELLRHAGAYTPEVVREHDLAGNLLWQASRLGFLDTRAYDSESRLIESGRRSNAIAQIETLEYAADGRLRQWHDNAGRYARIDYGPDGRPLAYRDSTGRRIELRAAPARQPAASARTQPAAQASTERLLDDFGRLVRTSGGQHGAQLYAWDQADRLVAMRDAVGNRADYEHDAAGRIALQRVQPADGSAEQLTRWHYQGRQLSALEHPTQSERYRYDARGLVASRSVTIAAADGLEPVTHTTRYLHDRQGRLAASSLPDGSWLHYERNGQGQVTQLVRGPVQTAWLRQLAREQVIARDFQRDLAGLKSYASGNGVQSQWQRDARGTLARIVHRQPAASPRLLQARLSPAAQQAIDRMLGIAPAHAHAASQGDAAPAAEQNPTNQPGALGLPQESDAFFDERYLWAGDGLLVHSQRRGTRASEIRHWAYDGAGQLIAGVQTPSDQGSEAPAIDVTNAPGAAPTRVWRYAYQGQRRVLAQEAASQDEVAGTLATAWDAQGRPRPAAAADSVQPLAAAYDANGQPTRLGHRHYRWDALGRLAAIEPEQGGQPLARYTYDHRGLRIAKQVGGETTRYLYGAEKNLLAEVDAGGRLQRQYIFLADLLLATLDTPTGQLAAEPEEDDAASLLSQEIGLWADLKALAASYLGQGGSIAYIHANHLGAPEAATDQAGQLIWQASYAPFGQASVRTAQAPGAMRVSERSGSGRYVLNIRLPGQYFDDESGLHYNRQRYYDPQQGAYLSPDPLGQPDGPNAYAYAANNPLAYVDPDGLVLFAFDGTDNDESSRTNVLKFRDLYLSDSRETRYVTGVGRDHRDGQYSDIISQDYDKWIGIGTIPDRGGNYSGPARIERMLLYFVDAAEAFEDDGAAMDIDIIGFSRGAAQARDFANRLVQMIDHDNVIRYQKHDPETGKLLEGQWACQAVNFRFIGLFDTVLSTNFSGHSYNLLIPSQFEYAAQAVALNEYRSSGPAGEQAYAGALVRNFPVWESLRLRLPNRDDYGGFPLQSIGASDPTSRHARIELGFIGAHSDIGGGYQDGSTLSDVSLSWMVRQAENAGVQMDAFSIDMGGSAILHDQSGNIRFGNPIAAPQRFQIDYPQPAAGESNELTNITGTYSPEDRQVRGAPSGSTQREMGFSAPSRTGGATSMVNADTHRFISYDARDHTQDRRPGRDIPELQRLADEASNRTGTVDMLGYAQWLLDNGYELR